MKKVIDDKMEFGMDVGRLLDRFLVDLGTLLGGKLAPSWHQNQKKIMKKAIDDKVDVGMDFGWLLARFLVDFRTKLGGKLGSSWH